MYSFSSSTFRLIKTSRHSTSSRTVEFERIHCGEHLSRHASDWHEIATRTDVRNRFVGPRSQRVAPIDNLQLSQIWYQHAGLRQGKLNLCATYSSIEEASIHSFITRFNKLPPYETTCFQVNEDPVHQRHIPEIRMSSSIRTTRAFLGETDLDYGPPLYSTTLVAAETRPPLSYKASNLSKARAS